MKEDFALFISFLKLLPLTSNHLQAQTESLSLPCFSANFQQIRNCLLLGSDSFIYTGISSAWVCHINPLVPLFGHLSATMCCLSPWSQCWRGFPPKGRGGRLGSIPGARPNSRRDEGKHHARGLYSNATSGRPWSLQYTMPINQAVMHLPSLFCLSSIKKFPLWASLPDHGGTVST